MPTTADWYAPLLDEIRSSYKSSISNIDSTNVKTYTFNNLSNYDYFQYLTLLSGGNEYLIYLRQSRSSSNFGAGPGTVYLGCINLGTGILIWEQVISGPTEAFFEMTNWGRKIKYGPLWIYTQFGTQYSIPIYNYYVSVSPKGIAFYNDKIYFIYSKICVARSFTISNPGNDWYLIHHWQSDSQRPESVAYPLVEYCIISYDINGNKLGENSVNSNIYPQWGKYGDPFPNTTNWTIIPTYELQENIFFQIEINVPNAGYETVNGNILGWVPGLGDLYTNEWLLGDSTDHLFTPFFWSKDNSLFSNNSLLTSERFTIKNEHIYFLSSVKRIAGIRNSGDGDAYWGTANPLYTQFNLPVSIICDLDIVSNSLNYKIIPNYLNYDWINQTTENSVDNKMLLIDGLILSSNNNLVASFTTLTSTTTTTYGLIGISNNLLNISWRISDSATATNIEEYFPKYLITNGIYNESMTPVNTITTIKLYPVSAGNGWFCRIIKIINPNTGEELYSKILDNAELNGNQLLLESYQCYAVEYYKVTTRILIYCDGVLGNITSLPEDLGVYPENIWTVLGEYHGPILLGLDGIFIKKGEELQHLTYMGLNLFTVSDNTASIPECLSYSKIIIRNSVTGRKFAWYGRTIPSFYFVNSIPADTATNVPVDSLISMTFDGKDNGYLDITTVNNNSMNLSYPSALIANYTNFGLASKTDVIQPEYKLPYSTLVTMNLSTDLKNTDGENLDQNYSFSFTTEAEGTPEPQPEPEGKPGIMNGMLFGTIDYVPIRTAEYKSFDISKILKLIQ